MVFLRVWVVDMKPEDVKKLMSELEEQYPVIFDGEQEVFMYPKWAIHDILLHSDEIIKKRSD